MFKCEMTSFHIKDARSHKHQRCLSVFVLSVFYKPYSPLTWYHEENKKSSTQYSSCGGGLAWIKDFECSGDPTSNRTN